MRSYNRGGVYDTNEYWQQIQQLDAKQVGSWMSGERAGAKTKEVARAAMPEKALGMAAIDEVTRLNPDEIEIMEPGELVSGGEPRAEVAEIDGGAPGAELVPVEVLKVEPIDEEIDEKLVVDDIIGMSNQVMRAYEEQTSVLENHDPLKAEMVQRIDDLKVTLTELQALHAANEADFVDGNEQKKMGLKLDNTEVGDSEIWRKGEMAMEDLYRQGILTEGQPAETKLEVLREMQKQLDAKLREKAVELKQASLELGRSGKTGEEKRVEWQRQKQTMAVERANYDEFLKKFLAAERYLEWAVAKEAKEKVDPTSEAVTDFPSPEALKR